jgi:hypothetical protein
LAPSSLRYDPAQPRYGEVLVRRQRLGRFKQARL